MFISTLNQNLTKPSRMLPSHYGWSIIEKTNKNIDIVPRILFFIFLSLHRKNIDKAHKICYHYNVKRFTAYLPVHIEKKNDVRNTYAHNYNQAERV